jgi:cell division FtsZ-interacting protein ZapD
MMTEVVAVLVSVGLVLVTIVSAVLVWRTKQQARQAATRARTEAVNYLREAQSELKNDRSVTPQAVVSLRKAKNLAEVVFSNRVRSDLNRALQTAEGASQRQRLLHEPNVDSKAIEASRKLEEDLQPIIDQMKREAQLRG